MKKLPIGVAHKTVSVKIDPRAWDRVNELSEKLCAFKADIVSVCLLHMAEEDIAALLTAHAEQVAKLPKSARGLLRNLHQLDADQRELMIEALSSPSEK